MALKDDLGGGLTLYEARDSKDRQYISKKFTKLSTVGNSESTKPGVLREEHLRGEKSEGAICSTDAKSVARPTSLNSNSNFSSSNSSSRVLLDSGVEGVVEIGGEGVVRPDSTKLLGYHLLTPCEINSGLSEKLGNYSGHKQASDYLKKGFKKDDILVSPSTGPENHILQYLMTNGLIAAS
uniref:Uncharacterized protein n=1 Tax=Timema bartmani TaxID=61472 RepID=A0A7R9F0U0_9NEOP|nr:unnamed protein product [Timema bartmani]